MNSDGIAPALRAHGPVFCGSILFLLFHRRFDWRIMTAAGNLFPELENLGRANLMDEPSSNLDLRGRRRLIGLLRGFEHTRIIATHDLELVVEVCSRLLVRNAGRIVAEGPTVEILNDETLMLAHGLERPHILRHRHPH